MSSLVSLYLVVVLFYLMKFMVVKMFQLSSRSIKICFSKDDLYISKCSGSKYVFPNRTICLSCLKSTLSQWLDQIASSTDRWSTTTQLKNIDFETKQLITKQNHWLTNKETRNNSITSGEINTVHPMAEKHCKILHHCGKFSPL